MIGVYGQFSSGYHLVYEDIHDDDVWEFVDKNGNTRTFNVVEIIPGAHPEVIYYTQVNGKTPKPNRAFMHDFQRHLNKMSAKRRTTNG